VSILRSMPSNKEVRLLWLIAVAVVAMILVWSLARVKPPTRAEVSSSLPLPAVKVSSASERPALTTRAKQGSASTRYFAALPTSATNVANTARSLVNQPVKLEPGLYSTEPFACLVVVPNPKFDDRMVIKPPSGEFSILSSEPGLRFMPVNPAK